MLSRQAGMSLTAKSLGSDTNWPDSHKSRDKGLGLDLEEDDDKKKDSGLSRDGPEDDFGP
jgi:hypothetical protein